jgi:pyridinium-3,5-biscarboxylic acid mononucleotide synthase
MTKEELHKLLTLFHSKQKTSEEVVNQIMGIVQLPHATIDINRKQRTGQPETIFGLGKTVEQIIPIVESLHSINQTVLITRLTLEKGKALSERFSEAQWFPVAQCFLLRQEQEQEQDTIQGDVAIICAGTSDLPVAEEARVTLLSHGLEATLYTDIGVAGIHRLFNRISEINKHKVLIVIAGMEGALTSVVAGLTELPVIGVPTSIGYGSHLQGITPLLAMLNSCAPGVVVTNIDNGYGAAMAAHRIVRDS